MEYTLDFFVGINEPFGITADITPPSNSIPNVNGVASIITNPSVSFDSSPPIKYFW